MVGVRQVADGLSRNAPARMLALDGQRSGFEAAALKAGEDGVDPVVPTTARSGAGGIQLAQTATVGQASAAQEAAYGEAQVIQTFVSKQWRGREFILYQAQNLETGNWEVRLNAGPNASERWTPDMLAFESDRPARVRDFGVRGELWQSVERTANALASLENTRDTIRALPGEGNAWDWLVGGVVGSTADLVGMIGGIPEDAVRATGGLVGGTLALGEEGVDALIRLYNPDYDGSRTGLNNPIRIEGIAQFVGNPNVFREAVSNVERSLTSFLRADPDSRQYALGELLVPLLVTRRPAAAAPATAARLPTNIGPEDVARMARAAPPQEIVRAVNSVSDDMLRIGLQENPQIAAGLRSGLQRYPTDAAARQTLARIDAAMANATPPPRTVDGRVVGGGLATATRPQTQTVPPGAVAPRTPSAPAGTVPGAATAPPPAPPAVVDRPWTDAGVGIGTYILRSLGYPTAGQPGVAPPGPAVSYPPTSTQIDAAVTNLPPETAAAVRPILADMTAGMSPAEAFGTLKRLAADPDAYRAILTNGAVDYANRSVIPNIGASGIEMRAANLDASGDAVAAARAYNAEAIAAGSDTAAYPALVNTPLGQAVVVMTGRLTDLARLFDGPLARGDAPRLAFSSGLEQAAGTSLEDIASRAREWGAFTFARDSVGPGLPIEGVTFEPVLPGQIEARLEAARAYNVEADAIRQLPDRTSDSVAFPVRVRTPIDGPSGGDDAFAILYGPAETVRKLVQENNPGDRLAPFEEGMQAAGRTLTGVTQIADAYRNRIAQAAQADAPQTAAPAASTPSDTTTGTTPPEPNGDVAPPADASPPASTDRLGDGGDVPPGGPPRTTATGGTDDPDFRVVPASTTAQDGGTDATDILVGNRQYNLALREDGAYRLAVPLPDGSGIRQYENLTSEAANHIAYEAAAAWNAANPDLRQLTADDIVVNANGIVPDRAGRNLNRQSEVVIGAPDRVQIGPPETTWPSGAVPDAMRLDPDQIDRVIDVLNAQRGGFRAGLTEPLIRPQLEAIARGDLNGALYDINPRYFHDRQASGIAGARPNEGETLAIPENKLPNMRTLAQNGLLGRLFAEHGTQAVDGVHRFGQMRQADGEPYPYNTTIIATRMAPGEPRAIDGPYRALMENIRNNIGSYEVIERVPGATGDDAWRAVEFATVPEEMRAVVSVLDGDDTARMIRMRDGPDGQWRYGWQPMRREADLDLRVDPSQPPRIRDRMDTSVPPEAFVGVPPATTDDAVRASLELSQDLIDFGARYPNGAAENAVTSLMLANARALPMVTDRSQASNTIMNAVVTAASREVVIGNSSRDGRFFDLNLPPLSMPAERALSIQLESAPIVDATTGATYDNAAKQGALQRVMQDMRRDAPDLYERVFGPDGGSQGPSDGPRGTGPRDGPEDRLSATEAEIFGSNAPSGGVTDAMRAQASDRLARYGIDSPALGLDGTRTAADFQLSVAAVDRLARDLGQSEIGLGASDFGRMLNRAAGSDGAATDETSLPEGLLRPGEDAAVPRSHLEWYARADAWLRQRFDVSASEVLPPFRYRGVEAMAERLERFAAIAERFPNVTDWGTAPPAERDLDEALPPDPTLRADIEALLGDLADIDEGPLTIDLLLAADRALRASGSAGIDVLVDLSTRPLASQLAQRIVGSAPVAVQSRGEATPTADALERMFVDRNGREVRLAPRRVDPDALLPSDLEALAGGRELSAPEVDVLRAAAGLGEASGPEIIESALAATGTNSVEGRNYAPSAARQALSTLAREGALRSFGGGPGRTYAVRANAEGVPDLSRRERAVLALMEEGRQAGPFSIAELARVVGTNSTTVRQTLEALRSAGLASVGENGFESALEPAGGRAAESSVVEGAQSLSSGLAIEYLYAGTRTPLDDGAVAMIRALHEGGEMTRGELSGALGISQSGSLFQRTLRSLLDEGVVVELGDREVGAGTHSFALAANIGDIDTRLTRDHRMILDFVRENGAVGVNETGRAFADTMSRTSAGKMLADLAAYGPLERNADGTYRLSGSDAVARADDFVPDAIDRNILGQLEAGERTNRQLAEATGQSVSSIGYRTQRLVEEGLVQRLGRSQLLSYVLADRPVENPTLTMAERAILERVRERGATEAGDLSRTLGLSERQLGLAIPTLLEAGLVERNGPEGGPYVYAVPGAMPPSGRPLDDIDRRMIDALGERELAASELAEMVGLSQASVSGRLTRLIEDGHVQRLGAGRAITYAPADAVIEHPELAYGERRALAVVEERRSVLATDLAPEIGYSRHGADAMLRDLAEKGFVEQHRSGRFVFYTMPGAPALMPNDYAVLDALADGPMTTNDLVEATGFAAATLRNLASSLEEAGLVERARSGRQIYYRLTGE